MPDSAGGETAIRTHFTSILFVLFIIYRKPARCHAFVILKSRQNCQSMPGMTKQRSVTVTLRVKIDGRFLPRHRAHGPMMEARSLPIRFSWYCGRRTGSERSGTGAGDAISTLGMGSVILRNLEAWNHRARTRGRVFACLGAKTETQRLDVHPIHQPQLGIVLRSMVCAMAIAAPELSPNPDAPPQPSAGLVEALLRLQKAAQLITSALDLDALLERVVNDVAESIGSVKVAVWLRDPDTDEMVLRGVRGRTEYPKGSRLKIGLEGMVGHVAATGQIRYAPDVRLDPCYIRCEPDTLCEVAVPLVNGGKVIGVISVDHTETEAFSEQERQVFQALASHISVAIENTHLFRRERASGSRSKQKSEMPVQFNRDSCPGLFRWSLDSPLKLPGIRRAPWPGTGSTSLSWVKIGTGLYLPTCRARAPLPRC